MSTAEQAIIKVVDGQIVAGAEFQLALNDLRDAAAAIIVADKSSCTSGKELVKRGRDDIKAITAAAEPERLRLQKALKALRGQRDKMIAEFSAFIDPLDRKCRDYDIAEKEATERERRRLQAEAEAKQRAVAEMERRMAEEQAKLMREAREKELAEQRKAGEIGKREEARLAKIAAEEEAKAKALAAKQAAETAAAVPQVMVKPDIEAVAGRRFQINYKFEVIDASKVNPKFKCPDMKAIGEQVRDDKNPELSMKEVGGIRVWKE